MKASVIAVLILGMCISLAAAQATQPATTKQAATRFPRPDVKYEYGPDSKRKEGVPRGKLIEFPVLDSKVYPGTKRMCAVYIPAQYDGSKPAALMVFQDGVRHYATDEHEYRVPIVFDNLIHAKQMPVTIALFINPGHFGELPTTREARASAKNRSTEYDTLSPAYATFLIDEMIPHIVKEYGLKITDDPEGRAICGQSSGGICAWTVAWERPDAFRKVVSSIGSFTNIKGGHVYPELVRTSEWKPIRVFLQDGLNDNRNRNPERNWVIANFKMAAALEEKDYDYKFVLGEGGHSGNHAGTIFPDIMRWLWRDYPKD
jgi:enterochelin esterase family protein